MPNELSMSSFHLNLCIFGALSRARSRKDPGIISSGRECHYMNFFIYFYYAASRNFHKKRVYCAEFCVCSSWRLNEHFSLSFNNNARLTKFTRDETEISRFKLERGGKFLEFCEVFSFGIFSVVI